MREGAASKRKYDGCLLIELPWLGCEGKEDAQVERKDTVHFETEEMGIIWKREGAIVIWCEAGGGAEKCRLGDRSSPFCNDCFRKGLLSPSPRKEVYPIAIVFSVKKISLPLNLLTPPTSSGRAKTASTRHDRGLCSDSRWRNTLEYLRGSPLALVTQTRGRFPAGAKQSCSFPSKPSQIVKPRDEEEVVQTEFASYGALGGRARAECDAREALDSCLQHAPPPHPGPSLPATDEEVTATCRSFKARIRCFDEFVGGCGDDGAREALNALSAGARRALHRLCDDRPFRQEYLKHGPCYRDVTPGWETCRGQFLSTTPSPNCCARQRFLACVHAEGERRCEAEGARLLRQIAAMLTDAASYRAPCPLDACARARAAPA
ncbi:Uncharacterized protein GBIM_08543, partial [Gryllus bimaculatus]